MSSKIICDRCGRKYKYDRSKGHGKTICNSCKSNTRRHELKKKLIEYKGGKCSICGYNKCIRALEFHHVDPMKKAFGLSGNHARSWKSVKAELDKCILVCSNCHHELEEAFSRRS